MINVYINTRLQSPPSTELKSSLRRCLSQRPTKGTLVSLCSKLTLVRMKSAKSKTNTSLPPPTSPPIQLEARPHKNAQDTGVKSASMKAETTSMSVKD